MIEAASMFKPRMARRKLWGRLFASGCVAATLVALAALSVLLGRVVVDGWVWLSVRFLTAFPSALNPETSGIKSALWGTIWLMLITVVAAIPVGICAAIYLEEYARKTRLTRFIELNIANLAGVPSIVYGILGLALFVRQINLGRSLLAAGLTLSLLILPVVIIACREALRAVPQSIRQAAFALGATRWQTVRWHVLPAATPGIMTGIILAISRAIGEAAPLILVGAMGTIRYVPEGPYSEFTAIPIQIYKWIDSSQPEFHSLAAAAIVVLLCVLLPMNATAVVIRAMRQRSR